MAKQSHNSNISQIITGSPRELKEEVLQILGIEEGRGETAVEKGNDKNGENKVNEKNEKNGKNVETTAEAEKTLEEILTAQATKTNLIYIDKEKDKKFISMKQLEPIFEFASKKPHLSQNSFIIIDNAHTLNLESQNILLKLLEEPPSYLQIILLTETTETLLETIRSRCEIKRVGDSYYAEVSKETLKKLKTLLKYFFSGKKEQIKQAYLEFDEMLKKEKGNEGRARILREFTKIVNSYLTKSLDQKHIKKSKIQYLENLEKLINKVNLALKRNVNYKLILDKIFLFFTENS